MNILVTAGNTFVPIDRVRGITNIFTGRTGAGIARTAAEHGHRATLVTSHPETANHPSLQLHRYITFDELHDTLKDRLRRESFDAVIHCAAVSDYQVDGAFSPREGTRFDGETWTSTAGSPALVQHQAAKIKSNQPELWLKLSRTPKLIDFFREPWGFMGLLVKFKLEAGVNAEELERIAERSRRESRADLMVANTFEERREWAILGPIANRYERIERDQLAEKLIATLEACHG